MSAEKREKNESFEDLLTSDKSNIDDGPDDLGSLVFYIAKLINYKLVVFVFCAYLALNTNIFIDKVIGLFGDDTVELGNPSEKGIFVQAGLLTIGFIVMSVLVNSDVI